MRFLLAGLGSCVASHLGLTLDFPKPRKGFSHPFETGAEMEFEHNRIVAGEVGTDHAVHVGIDHGALFGTRLRTNSGFWAHNWLLPGV